MQKLGFFFLHLFHLHLSLAHHLALVKCLFFLCVLMILIEFFDWFIFYYFVIRLAYFLLLHFYFHLFVLGSFDLTLSANLRLSFFFLLHFFFFFGLSFHYFWFKL